MLYAYIEGEQFLPCTSPGLLLDPKPHFGSEIYTDLKLGLYVLGGGKLDVLLITRSKSSL